MKKLYCFALLALSFSFFACSNDDSEDSKNPNTDKGPLSQLSEEAKKFVGCWNEGWIFYPDETCCRIDYSGYEVYREMGEWKYNDATKILVTTINNYQYTITLITDQAWSGISLGGNGVVSYHKYDAGYAGELLSKKRWKGKSNISITGDTYYTGDRLIDNINWRISGWENDDAFPEIKSPDEIYENGKINLGRAEYATAKVQRCLNISDVTFNSSTSLTMKATIDDEYYYTDERYGYKTWKHYERIFEGNLRFDDIYSNNSKLIIEGIMGGKSFKREYTSE